MNIPKITKKIGSFLSKEEGKISKESIIKTGVLLGTISLATVQTVDAVKGCQTCTSHSQHCNEFSLKYDQAPKTDAAAPGEVNHPGSNAVGTHGHAHCNHASHGSHCSGGWCD